MDSSIFGLYVLVLIILLMVWYAGFEGTMRVFQYVDLQLQYIVVRIKMRMLQRKIERSLGFPHKKYDNFIQEYNDD